MPGPGVEVGFFPLCHPHPPTPLPTLLDPHIFSLGHLCPPLHSLNQQPRRKARASQSVPYADIHAGHWYHAQFEFKDNSKINPAANTPATLPQPTRLPRLSVPPRATSLTGSSSCDKSPPPDGPVQGKAIWLFLTSFGGQLDSRRKNSVATAIHRGQPHSSPVSPIQQCPDHRSRVVRLC